MAKDEKAKEYMLACLVKMGPFPTAFEGQVTNVRLLVDHYDRIMTLGDRKTMDRAGVTVEQVLSDPSKAPSSTVLFTTNLTFARALVAAHQAVALTPLDG